MLAGGEGGAEAAQPIKEVTRTLAQGSLRERNYTQAAMLFEKIVKPGAPEAGAKAGGTEIGVPEVNDMLGYARALTGLGEQTGLAQANILQHGALNEANRLGGAIADTATDEKAANLALKKDILFDMTATYARMGDGQNARQCLGYVIGADPDNPVVKLLRRAQGGETVIPDTVPTRAEEEADPQLAMILRHEMLLRYGKDLALL